MVGTKELAAILRVGAGTVHRMHQDGPLGPRPVMTRPQFKWDLAEIDRWMAAGEPDRKTWRCLNEQTREDGRNND